MLVGYEMIIADSYPTRTRGIIAWNNNYNLPRQFKYMLNRVPYSVLRARKKTSRLPCFLGK